MRTTLVIEDELLVSAKMLAAEKGCSLSAVVAEALRSYVHHRDRPEPRSTFHVPTFGGSSGAPPTDSLPGELYQLEAETELAPFQR